MKIADAKMLELLAAIDLLREAGWTVEAPAGKSATVRRAAKKRVGRPPKAAKKRVGRPRKTAKKRVGRPPKNGRRGPGRPAKKSA